MATLKCKPEDMDLVKIGDTFDAFVGGRLRHKSETPSFSITFTNINKYQDMVDGTTEPTLLPSVCKAKDVGGDIIMNDGTRLSLPSGYQLEIFTHQDNVTTIQLNLVGEQYLKWKQSDPLYYLYTLEKSEKTTGGATRINRRKRINRRGTKKTQRRRSRRN